MKAHNAALAWCPFPDANSASSAATTLLEEQMIACANILPAITSVYRYEGNVTTDSEVGVLFKTTGAMLDQLARRLCELHPYATPAILGWHCDTASSATLEWLAETIDSGPG